jgi:AcrR family transcriptional regulator
MAPRTYTQRSRAAGSERTRARIIDAAVIEYRERGVGNASVQSIAARADVSRGTILNHFGDAEGLLAAVLETAIASVELPSEDILVGTTGLDQRARRFAEEMLRFYDRTQDWWHVFAGERDQLPTAPAFKEGERQFWAVISEFQHAALGELADHPTVLGAMSVLVSWNTVGQMKSVGLGADSAVALAADLFTDAVRHAARSSSAGG